MTISRLAKLALVAAAPLALAACDDAATTEGGVASGEPIPAVAAPAGATWTDTVTITPEGGYMVGNPDAPLKLVEYASHTCGACATFAVNGKPPLKDKYVSSGVVSFELRNLVRDPIDLSIATLVRCGAKENMQPLSDQAWASLEEIFATVQTNQAVYEAASSQPVEQRFVTIAQAAGLIDFFAARGLSADQSRACLADTAKVQAIADASNKQSEDLKINATPTFLLNGNRLDVTQWPQLEPLLQRAGAR
ncbi:thioredoxin domain-containing protein [Porphyrobacter sp. AAP60]|uniref:thioredoxin domain-containing protein n=1 Tax=Porphyrobacter sp. AAP60 TaxID=1523423 RepID=UPI0006B8F42B|nr:thioredoxin domain-containing protein [Porphyrobacter sp. AAP60]KPF62465.1 protein-disulfide isomerase [Porphyrobacter sp. AAP60]